MKILKNIRSKKLWGFLNRFFRRIPSLVWGLLACTTILILGLYLGYLKGIQAENSGTINYTSKDVTSILLNQFHDRYTAKTYLSGNFIIAIASSNTANPYRQEGEFDPNGEKASPLIIIVNKTTNKVSSVYELTFDAQNRSFYTGNFISQNNSSLINLDDDKNLEFASSWTIGWGGSAGSVGMVILKKEGDTYTPLTSYPSAVSTKTSESNFVVTNKFTKQQTILPIIRTDEFSEFRDLNGDGKDEFLYANFIWQSGEVHFGQHNWVLQVYEWNGKDFQFSKWWNDGKSFTTPEKVQYFDNNSLLLPYFHNKTNFLQNFINQKST